MPHQITPGFDTKSLQEMQQDLSGWGGGQGIIWEPWPPPPIVTPLVMKFSKICRNQVLQCSKSKDLLTNSRSYFLNES